MGKLVYSTATPCRYFLDKTNADNYRQSLMSHGYHPIIEPIKDLTINVKLIKDYYFTHTKSLEKRFDLVYKVTVPLTEK